MATRKVEFADKYAGAGMAFNPGDVAEIPEALAQELIECRQAKPYEPPPDKPADARKPAERVNNSRR